MDRSWSGDVNPTSYHVTAFELMSQLLCINFPRLERKIFLKGLIHILSISNSHNKVASVQKKWGDKLHRVIVASCRYSNHNHSKVTILLKEGILIIWLISSLRPSLRKINTLVCPRCSFLITLVTTNLSTTNHLSFQDCKNGPSIIFVHPTP